LILVIIITILSYYIIHEPVRHVYGTSCYYYAQKCDGDPINDE